MFFVVLYHESKEVEAIFLVQAAAQTEIPPLIQRDGDSCEFIQIPEPVWKAMLYTEKLVYRTLR